MLRILLATSIACGLATPLHAANWSVARVNHMLLAPPGGVTVQQMSGVTYVGPCRRRHSPLYRG